MIQATFIMEQHLGHQTYYQNLRRAVDASYDVRAVWVPVTYKTPAGVWDRLPFIPTDLVGSLRGRAEARRGITKSTSDVLFFNTQVPAVLNRSFAGQRPYVLATDITPIQYNHMSEQYAHRPDRFALLRWYKHQVNTAVLRGAARLLPWSNWAAGSLVRDYGVDPQRIKVVPPGVDVVHWRPPNYTPNGVPRILFVGGDLFRKGGGILLRAFRTLQTGAAELHLVTRTRLQPRTGVYMYHDLQPNDPALVALYQSASLFVLPSSAEAFGIAAVEACASGLPAIVSAVGGLTDIVIDGENGFLVQPDDVDALAAYLHRLVADAELRQRMGRAARRRAEERFSAQRNSQQVLDCLQEVAAQSNKVVYAT